MEAYRIRGGNRVSGQVRASGAKNAALPILAATIIAEDECVLENCPDIADVDKMKSILRALGCRVECDGDRVLVDSSVLTSCCVERSLMESMRSSMFLAGPLLARCGRAAIYEPGGCRIGRRPIDMHLDVLSALGAEISIEEADGKEQIILSADRLKGAYLELPFPSVGATENAMAAAVCADGITVIKGAAREPEIVCMQDFLNACGGKITGAGTETIVIEGTASLHGAGHRIIPDRIEGGTFLALAAMTGGELFLDEGIFLHMEAFASALSAAGCSIRDTGDGILLRAPERLKAVELIRTGPHPEFPTDLQPQMMAMLALADGISVIEENIFENRFGIVDDLNRMGTKILVNSKNDDENVIENKNNRAIINGVSFISGKEVIARDLRGGAALCMAAAAAQGECVVRDISHIDRGYCNFDKKLRSIGVDIQRINIQNG